MRASGPATDLDVLVVGAGLSGICAVHALRTACPDLRFAVVEARDRLGGTWDLFRYPGVRSDSDMYTLGFSFAPWTGGRAIASGAEILAYLERTADAVGLPAATRFGRRLVSASWSTPDARWTVRLQGAEGEEVLTTRFLWMCAGYYRYDRGHEPDFPGRERFAGTVVHPQHWPAGLDVTGKRVAVIGSGATAVTLVPALAAIAAEVVMVQRTPTWVVELPSREASVERVRRWLPGAAGPRAARLAYAARSTAFYRFCRRFPGAAGRALLRRAARSLGEEAVERDFHPPYDPWDQRVCVVPDGDLFAALRSGRARVVTDRVEGFTERGLRLAAGGELAVDVVVTATGLELQFGGGARFDVDGVEVDPGRCRTYLASMLSGVPNLTYVMGYLNASWTLKAELVSERTGRLLRLLRDEGFRSVVPVAGPEVADRPGVEMTSGYFARSRDHLPRQGDADPWRIHQDWFVDRRVYRDHPLQDGVLRFSR